MPDDYRDIIDMPHHVSKTHPRMSMTDRGAQFAPFKSLSGYEESIGETARTVERRVELDEPERERVMQRLAFLAERTEDPPEVTLTVFRPDGRKYGGAYVPVTGRIVKADVYLHRVRMEDGTQVYTDDIYAVEGAVFDRLEANGEETELCDI